jgi:hypothetical protein
MFTKTYPIKAYVAGTSQVSFEFEIRASSVGKLNDHTLISDGVVIKFDNLLYLDVGHGRPA